jgi:hypothetical protein
MLLTVEYEQSQEAIQECSSCLIVGRFTSKKADSRFEVGNGGVDVRGITLYWHESQTYLRNDSDDHSLAQAIDC